jgi:predicted nucleic acid-binding protein
MCLAQAFIALRWRRHGAQGFCKGERASMSACLGEIAVGVGNADPARITWRAMRNHYAGLFDSIPENRILDPDAQIRLDAGLIAGTLARTQGFQRHQRKERLNDALILLTAARAGISVLTANRDEFDLIQQIAPEVRFVYY